jgi:hypothetical protein
MRGRGYLLLLLLTKSHATAFFALRHPPISPPLGPLEGGLNDFLHCTHHPCLPLVLGRDAPFMSVGVLNILLTTHLILVVCYNDW